MKGVACCSEIALSYKLTDVLPSPFLWPGNHPPYDTQLGLSMFTALGKSCLKTLKKVRFHQTLISLRKGLVSKCP